VVLVDAEKGVRVQTRRHTHIVALLGVQNIIVAVNKMDRIDYDKAKFETIAAEVVTYARKLGVQNIEVIPVAALVGVNVVARGTAETPWYTGRTLLEALEGIEVGRNDGLKELRFPIQYVSRPDANFRGYAGTIASGEISVGDKVLALPSRKTSTVAEITTADGPLEKAGAAQAVTVVLADEIDLSRGDVLVHPDHRPTLARTFDAHILWMGEAPLLPGKRYEFKIGPRYVKGLVDSIQHRIDVNDLSTRETEALDLNGLARVRIALEEPVAIDDYKQSRATGSFIIVDLLHFGTVGAGMVIAPQAHAQKTSSDVVWQATRVTATVRANQKNQKPCVIWLTGLSGAGKSTIANGLEQVLVQRGHHSYLLDGDNVRHGLNRDLNFSEADRNENIRRIGEVAALFVDAGLIVVTAFISPFRADRDRIRERIGDAQFIEIYVSTPLVECEKRDPKGLYVKARAGQIREFTGIDSPYEPPLAPRLSIDTSKVPVTDAVDQIIHYLENKGFLHVVDPGL
jgi:bifunctional enzyme CysN/CysC